MATRMKELLRQGQLVRVFPLGLFCDPKYVEIVGLCGGYHGVWLDQEHAALSVERIEQAARAARGVGLDSFVRLAPTDYATIMRPLEAGAGGIMAAQVHSARQVEEIVGWAKFAPRGMRGFNNGGYDGRYGTVPIAEYTRRANEETFIAVQIEHRDAVADVEKIAAVPDVDVLFIGPADLSQSLGVLAEWDHPRLWEAIEQVAAAARRHGTHWGILSPTPAHARRCVELGCRFLSLSGDVPAIRRGLQAWREDYADIFRA